MAATSEVDARAGRYGILLTQGTFYTTGLQLANVGVVLPFICAQQGIFWAAALLYPAYSIGVIVGNSISPVILEWSRHLKHLVISATALTMAALILCNAIAATAEVGIAMVFLATSLATGITNGLSKVAYSEVLSSKLTEMRRGDLILIQGATGAAVTIASTLLLIPVIDRSDPVSSHVDLLWLGAAGMAAAGIAAVFVGPVRPRAGRVARRLRDTYREGMIVARTERWFRGYAVTQLMFVPISLGSTFYSIHAAAQHGNKPGSLHILVIASGVGLIVGSFLWRAVYRSRFGIRAMLVVSALISCAAAVMCILAEVYDAWSHPWVHAIVILLATVANQAILAASISWINIFAADHHRATLMGFAAVLVGVEMSVLGAVFGGIAQQTSAIWPVTIILVLNAAAVVAALRAPTRM
jgi:predicted MFS family arabinose efflux permease